MLNPPDPAIVARIAETLRRARRLLFITGAGISADSGLPTYRGIGGLYNDQATEENFSIETALSGSMLEANPAITWKYLHQIENSCRGARFNDAHAIIAEWQDRFEVCVLTQNIDGFHRDAGSRNLIEMHGDIHDLLCTRCDYAATVPDYSELDMPPSCPRCHARVRPRVVLFGEVLPSGAIQHLYRELDQGFDLVFSIGTTSVFPYIAGPVVQASQMGVPTVEINPTDTNVTRFVDYKLASSAAASLRAIREALLNAA
ncbi:MAG TPA: NAD-dependent protein deacylase [Candidatus Competibacteraceae bacterium]|nr:NAD-dependent protein deacylase [Candidatus Competibacteraceae bacterium]HSA48005.1 NAD-dependent protein deacylase [Candidatus Competibacteraceae bacterium]